MKFHPTTTDEFEARTAFFTSVGRSRGVAALTEALLTDTVTPEDRPALRAARLIVKRGGGKDLTERVAMERMAFAHTCAPGCGCPTTA